MRIDNDVEIRRSGAAGVSLVVVTLAVLLTSARGQCPGSASEYAVDHNTVRVLKSPNYPNRSNTSLSCAWLLRAPDIYGDRVTLTIRFSKLIRRTPTGECLDYVRVYDGENSSSPLIVEWCDVENPESITSTSGLLYVEYKGGGEEPFTGKYGFAIRFSSFTIGTDCPVGWSALRTSCYKFRNANLKSWSDAQVMCTYDAANLVTIDDEEENMFIQEEFEGLTRDGDSCVWIGLEDYSTPKREDLWVDGSNFTYLMWPFDPYDDYSRYACMVSCLQSAGVWYKRACNSLRSYICKKSVYGTTKRYPVPVVADYSNGLEIVAMVAVAVMLFIFVALFVGFMAINIKSCRALHAKQNIQTQSYTAVNEHSVSMDDDDDENETVRTNVNSLQGEPSADETSPKTIERKDGTSQTGSDYDGTGARPKLKMSSDFKYDSLTNDKDETRPNKHPSEVELKQLGPAFDILPTANTDSKPSDQDISLGQIPTLDLNPDGENLSLDRRQVRKSARKKEVVFVIRD